MKTKKNRSLGLIIVVQAEGKAGLVRKWMTRDEHPVQLHTNIYLITSYSSENKPIAPLRTGASEIKYFCPLFNFTSIFLAYFTRYT